MRRHRGLIRDCENWWIVCSSTADSSQTFNILLRDFHRIFNSSTKGTIVKCPWKPEKYILMQWSVHIGSQSIQMMIKQDVSEPRSLNEVVCFRLFTEIICVSSSDTARTTETGGTGSIASKILSRLVNDRVMCIKMLEILPSNFVF